MTMERAIIETNNLTKRFLRHDAVHDVCLRVPNGSVFALIGANGAGKTTTLRMLVNLLTPDSGAARVLGVDSRRLSHQDFLRIGYVSENQKLPDQLTVAQYFNYIRVLYPNWDLRLEQELLLRFALPPDRVLGRLSHGMRMKTMLTSVLSFRPQLLILDEPLSGLDPLVRDEVMEGLLHQADETTIVISSHELSEIEGCTTHIAFMDKGRVLFQEAIDDLCARFREISVTFVQQPESPKWPGSWLTPEFSTQSFRCIETAYLGDDDVVQKLSACFGSIQHFEARPMSLRDISKALMRAMRVGVKQ